MGEVGRYIMGGCEGGRSSGSDTDDGGKGWDVKRATSRKGGAGYGGDSDTSEEGSHGTWYPAVPTRRPRKGNSGSYGYGGFPPLSKG